MQRIDDQYLGLKKWQYTREKRVKWRENSTVIAMGLGTQLHVEEKSEESFYV